MQKRRLKEFLDEKVRQYNQPSFVADDPVCVPHLFTKKHDIEIAGFFASIFAWGNRTIIIKKSKELMQLMDNAPHDFIINHTDNDLKKLLDFKHRTFNTTDLLYFIHFLNHHYAVNESMETAFSKWGNTMQEMLTGFHYYFFSLDDAPLRTKKHISTPVNNSTCKRLNMFMRWMVRQDNNGVDFGIWKNIKPSKLIIPIDLHVAKVAKRLGLLYRKQTDWNAAKELTEHLKKYDANDPAKYDFALFGLGVVEKYY